MRCRNIPKKIIRRDCETIKNFMIIVTFKNRNTLFTVELGLEIYNLQNYLSNYPIHIGGFAKLLNTESKCLRWKIFYVAIN